jgi:DHA2 family multidrug resistance protein
VTGIALFFRDTHRDESLKFDWLGFAMLGVGIGALQLMLDRGSDKDWFNSSEIVLETIIAGLGIYLFVVHMILSKGTFIPKDIFRDRSFVSSLFLMFQVGLIMLASSALLPPYLQNLAGYSVRETGLLMAPRGVGTMLTMATVGRFAYRTDPRKIMTVGTVLMLWSLWEMSRWTPDIATWHLVVTTFVQGIGMGMVFVPMNLVSFATLSPVFRTDGSAFLNLMRNLGSSIGVSLTTTFLTSSVQTVHAELAEHANRFNRMLGQNAASMMLNPQMPNGVQALDRVVNYNAQIISYSNDFLFMFLVSLPALIAILLMPRPPPLPKPQEFEVME